MVNKTHGAKKSNLLYRRVTIYSFLKNRNSLIFTNILSGIWLTHNITNICVKGANMSIPATADSKSRS